jgi:hypothetical protein
MSQSDSGWPEGKGKRSRKRKKRMLSVETDVSDTESEFEQPTVDPDSNGNGLDASAAHSQQHLSLVESSDRDDDIDLNRSADDTDSGEMITSNNLKQGDYILVQLKGLKNTFHYVAQIKEPVAEKNDAKITLPSKFSGRAPQFVLPESAETFGVPHRDILRKLPQPTQAGRTKRMSHRIIFHMSFDGYNLA